MKVATRCQKRAPPSRASGLGGRCRLSSSAPDGDAEIFHASPERRFDDQRPELGEDCERLRRRWRARIGLGKNHKERYDHQVEGCSLVSAGQNANPVCAHASSEFARSQGGPLRDE